MAALLAAVIAVTAAQGMAASEEPLQSQEQTEQVKDSEPEQDVKPAPAPAPEPKPAETAKQPEPAPKPTPAPEPAPKPTPAPEPAPKPTPAPEPAPTPEPAKQGGEQASQSAQSSGGQQESKPAQNGDGEQAKETQAAGEPAGSENENKTGETASQETDVPEDGGKAGSEGEDIDPDEAAQDGEDKEPEEADLQVSGQAAGSGAPTDEKQTEEEPASEETLQAADEESQDDPDGEKPEDQDDTADTNLGLESVQIADDSRGVYISYTFKNKKDLQTKITFTLVDSGGNVVGTPVVKNLGGSINERTYLLGLSSNVFALSTADMGSRVSLRIKAENADGEQTETSTGAVLLRLPSISMPSVISYGAIGTAKEMYDSQKVSGVSYDAGSCETEVTVEKVTGGSAAAVPGDRALTGNDAGTYQIRVHTVLGDVISNRFLFAVPVTGISVEGDIRLGCEIKATGEGVDGYEPTGLTYRWTFGDASEPVCTEQFCKPSLSDAVSAETLTLKLSVSDAIGNVFDYGMELAPLDLSKADLRTGGGSLTYTGFSQIPSEAGVLLDDWKIPETMYKTAAAAQKNTTDAGTGWMEVIADSAYLTNTGLVSYVIEKAVLELTEEDFIRSFEYDERTHCPVLSKDADPETAVKLRYRRWRRKSGSSWVTIQGAPSLPGTYRVNVVIIPKDPNYAKLVLKKMMFKITGEVKPKTKETAAPDLTVTDKYGNPAAYRASAVFPAVLAEENGSDGTEQADSTDRKENSQEISATVYQITAAPDEGWEKAEDPDVQVHYSQRCLNITKELLDRMEAAGCTALRFVLGDAAIEMDAQELKEGVPFRLKLASLEKGELNTAEEKMLQDNETAGSLYAVRISHVADGQEAPAEDVGLTASVRVSDEEKDGIQGLLFLKENRRLSTQEGEAVHLSGKQIIMGEKQYIAAGLDGTGTFCLCR